MLTDFCKFLELHASYPSNFEVGQIVSDADAIAVLRTRIQPCALDDMHASAAASLSLTHCIPLNQTGQPSAHHVRAAVLSLTER